MRWMRPARRWPWPRRRGSARCGRLRPPRRPDATPRSSAPAWKRPALPCPVSATMAAAAAAPAPPVRPARASPPARRRRASCVNRRRHRWWGRISSATAAITSVPRSPSAPTGSGISPPATPWPATTPPTRCRNPTACGSSPPTAPACSRRDSAPSARSRVRSRRTNPRGRGATRPTRRWSSRSGASRSAARCRRSASRRPGRRCPGSRCRIGWDRSPSIRATRRTKTTASWGRSKTSSSRRRSSNGSGSVRS